MARMSNQKKKLLLVKQFLEKKTDINHMVTTEEIVSFLEKEGVPAERKSIYGDIDTLNDSGTMFIEHKRAGSSFGYYVADRLFELAELKMLVDIVQASRSISANKSDQLITKLESLASEYEAKELHRQVFISNRVKTMNSSILYNVDTIHRAISSNESITFRYFHYSPEKKKEYRKESYEVSPFALIVDDECYYLLGYNKTHEEMRTYRVDKMSSLNLTGKRREGAEVFARLDMSKYNSAHFGMFAGEQTGVRMRFSNDLAGAVIDRFGMDIIFVPDGDSFTCVLPVVVSDPFFGWVLSFGNKAKILGPESVLERFRTHLKASAEQYE